MKHEMRLNSEPFKNIKNGTKTIELRLNDEKRQLLNVGDILEFTNRQDDEKLCTKIIGLHHYDNFIELYKHFDKVSMGYREDEIANPEDMEKYYSKEEQEKYGVVGIEVEVIK